MPRVANLHPSSASDVTFYGTGFTVTTGDAMSWPALAGTKMCIRPNEVRRPSDSFMLVEWAGQYNSAGTANDAAVDIAWSAGSAPRPPHHGRFNCLFHDGHVSAVTEKETIGSGTPGEPRGLWTRFEGD
jgi:prepilin-type processing-associated H-X9-DG protein